MKQSIVHSFGNGIKRLTNRTRSAGLPSREEIERFGADGEEDICRLLRQNFECVLRNVVVPHKKKYLEKDFMVIFQGVPFVIEVKAWKGTVRKDGDVFYQDKANGIRKTLKSPIGTTKQFLSCMKDYYGLTRPVYGIVVFADANCILALPEQADGITLLKTDKLISYIKDCVKKEDPSLPSVDADRILRCTRFYSMDEEFCKGMLVEEYLDLYTEDGKQVYIDTNRLRFITVQSQSLRLRDKLYITYDNGVSDVFYNRDTTVTVACLDGTFRKISLNKIRHIVF